MGRQPAVLLGIEKMRPTQVIKKLRVAFASDPAMRAQFGGAARANAVMGNCPKSRASFASGIECYCQFAELMFGSEGAGWPPTVDSLVTWSHTFSCVGTFRNYEGQLVAQ